MVWVNWQLSQNIPMWYINFSNWTHIIFPLVTFKCSHSIGIYLVVLPQSSNPDAFRSNIECYSINFKSCNPLCLYPSSFGFNIFSSSQISLLSLKHGYLLPFLFYLPSMFNWIASVSIPMYRVPGKNYWVPLVMNVAGSHMIKITPLG